jgi:hypothetical protein
MTMKRYSSLPLSSRNLASPLPGRRASTAAAGALLCALAGCITAPGEPGEPNVPGEPRLVRTSFAFQVDPAERDFGMFLSLDERDDVRGQLIGNMTVNGVTDIGFIAVDSMPAMGTMDERGVLRIPAGALPSTPGGLYLEWDDIELRLQDQDGDGVMESGTGHIAGTVHVRNRFDDDVTAAPDGFPVTARVYRASQVTPEMLPWETLVVALDQPVSSDEIPRHRVLADGQEVPGQIELVKTGEIHTAFRFTPDGFYPLGATIEIALDGMKNAIGVPMTLEAAPIEVMADPGSFEPNLGFEQALTGWYVAGDAAVVAGAGNLAPVEGAGMLALRTAIIDSQDRDSRLLGYLDVPADATTLDLSLALLVPEEQLPGSIAMRLHRALPDGGHEVLEVYEFDHESVVLEPCACGGLGTDPPLARRAGPFRQEIDLSALRGQRVFLEIQLFGEPWSGPSVRAVAPIPPPIPAIPAMLLVDDLQIR